MPGGTVFLGSLLNTTICGLPGPAVYVATTDGNEFLVERFHPANHKTAREAWERKETIEAKARQFHVPPPLPPDVRAEVASDLAGDDRPWFLIDPEPSGSGTHPSTPGATEGVGR